MVRHRQPSEKARWPFRDHEDQDRFLLFVFLPPPRVTRLPDTPARVEPGALARRLRGKAQNAGPLADNARQGRPLRQREMWRRSCVDPP